MGRADTSIGTFECSTRLERKLCLQYEKCASKWAHVVVDSVFVNRTRSRIWNSSLPERVKVFFWLITHRVSSNWRAAWERCGMSSCKACSASLEDIPHCLWSCPRAQEVWTRSLRILARCGPDVHVLRTTVTWLATESAMWFQGWNGNSPLKSIEIYYKCQDLYQIMDYHILGRMLTTLSYNRTTRANSLIWLRSLHEK